MLLLWLFIGIANHLFHNGSGHCCLNILVSRTSRELGSDEGDRARLDVLSGLGEELINVSLSLLQSWLHVGHVDVTWYPKLRELQQHNEEELYCIIHGKPSNDEIREILKE